MKGNYTEAGKTTLEQQYMAIMEEAQNSKNRFKMLGREEEQFHLKALLDAAETITLVFNFFDSISPERSIKWNEKIKG